MPTSTMKIIQLLPLQLVSAAMFYSRYAIAFSVLPNQFVSSWQQPLSISTISASNDCRMTKLTWTMIKAKVFVDEEFQKQMSDKRETCSPADLQRLEEDSFDYWDTNHDGNISLQELKKGFQGAFQMQVTDHDAKELMYIFDENGDGLLQKEEFADLKEFRCKLVVMAHKERRKANVDPKEDGDKAGATSWTDRLVSALSHAFNS